MAASGIQEHNEARRKERVIMKASKRDKELRAAIESGQVMYAGQNSNNNNQGGYNSSYDREVQSRSQFRVVGSPPGMNGTDPVSVDRYCNNVGMFGRAHYFNESNSASIRTNAYRCPVIPELPDYQHQLPTTYNYYQPRSPSPCSPCITYQYHNKFAEQQDMSNLLHSRELGLKPGNNTYNCEPLTTNVDGYKNKLPAITPPPQNFYQTNHPGQILLNQEGDSNIKLWSAPYIYQHGDPCDRKCKLPINEDRCQQQALGQGSEKYGEGYSNCIYLRCPPLPQRRMEHYNNQRQEYSAKIPGRFRNFDYQSQW